MASQGGAIFNLTSYNEDRRRAKKMTISELIKELEVIKRAKGDIDVAVKYRDDGGEYLGQDEFIYLHVFSEDGDKEYLLL